MVTKNNTRKAGMKKVMQSCQEKANKTLKIMQNIKPLKTKKNKDKRRENYLKSCSNMYEFKNDKWVPKCDKIANNVTKTLVNLGKKISGKPISKSERQKTYNQVKQNCLKAYRL